MALPALLQALFDRLQTYNGDAYDATTNPGGFARGGNQKPVDNFIKSVRDFTAFGKGIAENVQGSTSVAAEAASSAAAERQAAQNAATDSYDQAQLSAASAAASAVQAQRLQGTSTTAQTPSIASKTFTTQAGKAFDVGNDVRVQSRSNINRWMAGRVTAYSGTSVTISVIAIGTVVTAASDWDIRIAGTQGVQGIPGIPTMGYSARSSSVQIARADSAKLIDLTGTFTQAFDTPANLGADWFSYIRNSGDGDITIPASDGVSNWIMYPGEVRLFQCDGIAIRSVVLSPFYKRFENSATFVKPPGYSGFSVFALGGSAGGGGGYYNTDNTLVRGGSSGTSAYAKEAFLPAPYVSNTVPVTIGAGGAPGANGTLSSKSGTNGSPGGTSLFGTLLSAAASVGGIGAIDTNSSSGPGTAGATVQTSGDISYGAVSGTPGSSGQAIGPNAPSGSGRLFNSTGKGGDGGTGRGTGNQTMLPPTAGVAGELIVQGVM